MLLDLVQNTEEFTILDTVEAEAIFEGNDFFTRPEAYVVESEDALRDAVSGAKNSLTTEGVVLRDANNLMVKVKSSHYKKVKSLRGPLARVLNGKEDERALPVLDSLAKAGKSLDDFLVEDIQGNISVDLPKIAPYIS